jgi:3-methyladenine DNA glycosylase/8-oxoguanine DNA glycosylase
MKFTVTPAGPLDAGATLARFHVWGEDPANRVGDGSFRRALRHAERLWPWEARWSGPVDDVRIDVEVPDAREPAVEAAVRAEVERIFGLPFDLPAFYRFAKSDRVLAGLVGPLYGLRPTLAPNGLEMIVGLICAQQVNLQFAYACRARLVRKYGTRVDDTLWAFPDAAALAGARVSALKALKFSTRKGEYLRDLGRALTSGALDFATLDRAPDAQVIETLTALRGFGRWTAEWYLARCLGRGDVCPAGDLGVRRACERYYGRGRELSERAVRRRAKPWGGHGNLAIHYLLAGLRLGLVVS